MALLRTKRVKSPQTLSYTSGATSVLAQGLELDLPLHSIDLLLTGRVVLTGAAPGTFLPEAIQNLISSIRIYGNRRDGKGNVTLYSCSGPSLRMQSVFHKGIWPRSAGITPLASAAAGTYDFLALFPVPFVAERVGIQDVYRTILDPSRFSTLQLEVSWGTQTSAVTGCLISGGTNTIAFSSFGVGTGSPTLTYLRHIPLLGGEPFGTHYLSRIERQANLGQIGNVTRSLLTGAGDIPTGNMIKSIMLRQYSELSGFTNVVDQSAGASLFLAQPNAALTGVTHVYLMRNTSIPDWDIDWNQLVDYNRSVFAPAVNRPAIASIDDQGTPDGYALIDFAADSGSLDDCYDLRQGFPPSKIQIFIDSTGTATQNRVNVFYQELSEWGQ